MVEIEAKITFTRLLCSCPCILTWTHLITQKNRCLQTYTYRLYTHSHEYAGLYWSAVDESEYTHGIGGAVQHCLLTYEDTFFTFYIINVIQLVLVSCHNYIRSLPTPSHHKLCSGLLLLDTDWSVDKTWSCHFVVLRLVIYWHLTTCYFVYCLYDAV